MGLNSPAEAPSSRPTPTFWVLSLEDILRVDSVPKPNRLRGAPLDPVPVEEGPPGSLSQNGAKGWKLSDPQICERGESGKHLPERRLR